MKLGRVIFLYFFSVCVNLFVYVDGKMIYEDILWSGIKLNGYFVNVLMNMYRCCGSLMEV